MSNLTNELEPAAVNTPNTDDPATIRQAVSVSHAISAKRQADALERIAYMLELFPDKFSG